jgi:hypothetical protein
MASREILKGFFAARVLRFTENPWAIFFNHAQSRDNHLANKYCAAAEHVQDFAVRLSENKSFLIVS